MAENQKSKKLKPRRRGLKIFLGIIIFLVIIRLILPFVVLHYANKMLATLEGYYGHVEDIDIALYRGAYQVKDMYLNKIDSANGLQVPFFELSRGDLSVEWKSLFHGRFVGEFKLDRPRIYFKKDKTEPGEVAKDTNDFRRVLDGLMPLKVNRFEIEQGEIHYVDSTAQPYVDIKMDSIHVLAENLSNVVDTSSQGLPSSVDAFARVYRGTFNLNMRLDPLAKQSKFDLNAEIKNTYLPDLNNFFKAYAKVDVNAGTFGMYTELASADGKFVGYVKPIIKDLDVVGPEDRKDSFFHKLWESAVGTTATIFSNWSKDQFATKIPLKGKLSNPDPNIWVTVFEVLRNAFINALQPSIDYDINIATVEKAEPEKKNLIQKIFGGKSKDEEHKSEDKKSDSNQKPAEHKKK
jgi:hypothetical protein